MKIAIASGKGGTGKTLLSTNLFRVAQKMGYACTLVDCDAEEPNVQEFFSTESFSSEPVIKRIPVIDVEKCKFCGKCHEYCSYHAIVYLPPISMVKVVEELCHDCGACFLACKHKAITEKEVLSGKITVAYLNAHASIVEGCAEIGEFSPVRIIRKAIATADQDSFVILDSPPGISCPFIATVETADYVVLVTEPTPFGLNDLKLSVETLQQLNKSFGVIINRAGLGNNDVYQWLKEQQIPLLMEIPFDKEVAHTYSKGKLIVDTFPEYSNRFRALLKSITETHSQK
jgi:MinD superfamily P-loop ATPase